MEALIRRSVTRARHIPLALLLFHALSGCTSEDAAPEDERPGDTPPPSQAGEPPSSPPSGRIVPGVGIGPVTAEVSERALIDSLGAAQVVRSHAYIGEGVCAAGSRVYPDTPAELEVMWTDSTYSLPARVEVARSGSPWRTDRGVGIGTTVAELETLAGGPITFSGFGWDYGGSARWDEGNDFIGLRLSADSASDASARSDPRFNEILGDRQIRSDHPLVRSMTIRIERIYLTFRGTELEYNCPLP
jgi:hypothetical protein